MKKNLVLTALLGSLLLAGCNSGSEESGEEIQKKIEDIGWKLTTDDSNTGYESTNFIINENERVKISHNIDKDHLVGVIYREGSEEDYVGVPYGISDNVQIQHVVKQGDHTLTTCAGYDLDKHKESELSKESESFSVYGKCSIEEIDRLTNARDRAKELIEETGITTKDLVTWGEWKYNTKLIDKKDYY